MRVLKQSALACAGRMVAAVAAVSLIATPALVQAQQAQPEKKKPAAGKSGQPAQQPAQQSQPAQGQPVQQGQPAQQAPPANIVQVKSEPSQADWTKACGKDPSNTREICYTTRDFVSDQGVPVIAVAVYDVKGEAQKMVRFLLPLQLLLSPGLRVGFDQSQPINGNYAICFPNGCFAEAQLKDTDVAAMKKATNLNVMVQNQVGAVVTFQVPLAGFGKAFDGAAVDPQVLEEQKKKALEQQKSMQEQLQKRGREELEKRSTSSAAPAVGGANAKQ